MDWAWQGLCCQFAKGSSPFKDVSYVNDANSYTIVLGQATYLFNNRIMTREIVVSDNAIGLAPVGGFCLFAFYNPYCLMKGNYMSFCLEN